MPNSPKASLVAPLASPLRFGWCCLRCLTRRGINMSGSCGFRGRGLSGDGILSPATATTLRTAGAALATRTTRRTRTTGGGLTRGLLGGALGTRAGDVALVDPHLHTDPAERRLGLVEAVVDVGAQRVQRDATLAVELRAAHLSAAQSTGAHDLDGLGAGTHRGLLRLAHRPAERHTGAQQLVAQGVAEQLSARVA